LPGSMVGYASDSWASCCILREMFWQVSTITAMLLLM